MLLFTPGPLTISPTVRETMQRDIFHLGKEFEEIVSYARRTILEIAEVSADDWTSIQLQGPGMFACEAILRAAVNRDTGKALIFANGFYGHRLKEVCNVCRIPEITFPFPENKSLDLNQVESILMHTQEPISLVGVVACETTLGLMNNILEIGKLVKKYHPEAIYFINAISCFGAEPLHLEEAGVDILVTSINKALQGVPGFSFALLRKSKLHLSQGNAQSWALDVVGHESFFEQTKVFKFTPPVHPYLAFDQALKEYLEEGGREARLKRYKENMEVLHEGMSGLGFRKVISDEDQSCIVISYYQPTHHNFDFIDFADRLLELGIVIFRLKLSQASIVRVGTIGHLFTKDFEFFVESVEKVLNDMEVPIPVPYDEE